MVSGSDLGSKSYCHWDCMIAVFQKIFEKRGMVIWDLHKI
jgi:hypothetical protein